MSVENHRPRVSIPLNHPTTALALLFPKDPEAGNAWIRRHCLELTYPRLPFSRDRILQACVAVDSTLETALGNECSRLSYD
jgi:hypothetical protein